VIGGGSAPGQPAPAGYDIGTCDTKWTLQIGKKLHTKPGATLPPPMADENGVYTTLLRHNSPVPLVNAPAESGFWLFENDEWIYSDGSEWIRMRERGSQAETMVFAAAKRVIDNVNTGVHVDSEYTWLIGAGYLLCRSNDCHNYLIGVDGTSWTRVIGGKVTGNFDEGGWYDFLDPTLLEGFGPPMIESRELVSNNLSNTELSNIFDWSQDPGYPANQGPFFRVHEPGGVDFTLYAQVPEGSLEGKGITFNKIPGVSLLGAPNSIRLHYFDVTQNNWQEPSFADLDGSLVTSDDFTLKLEEVKGGARRLQL